LLGDLLFLKLLNLQILGKKVYLQILGKKARPLCLVVGAFGVGASILLSNVVNCAHIYLKWSNSSSLNIFFKLFFLPVSAAGIAVPCGTVI